ncbi:hypothetical protein RHSIM_RhsimUnG0173500 [Rhododendron simsii]|uniref:Ubiquitin-like protease family profile domain-containing protein n=1 Tax=Rhododendron simsii TaxID=118357 RepID=A0A834FW99_RHOSS|nr:hypothetical protein RHSIM_RhsimUnG0173500 [Rhododendron simsii]
MWMTISDRIGAIMTEGKGRASLSVTCGSRSCSILNIARRPKISFPLVHVGLHLVLYNGEMKRLGTGYAGLIKAVFESSTSLLTNKEKDKKEQSSGHLTSLLKANEEETRLSDSSMAASWSRRKSPSKPTMECQQEMTRAQLKESQPVKKNANEKPTIGMVRKLILKFVFDTTLSVREQLCNLGISYATRSDFMSLRKNGWVVGENEKILHVLEYLDDVIQHLGNNGCVMKAHKLPIKRLKWLPIQEPGSDDCGVHTAKYFDLEQFNEEEAAKLRFNSEEARNSLILDLILCGENVIRNEVIRKVQEKYRNTRRII